MTSSREIFSAAGVSNQVDDHLLMRGSMFAVGSSASSRLGLFARARATGHALLLAHRQRTRLVREAMPEADAVE